MIHNVEISIRAYELMLRLDEINQRMTVDSLVGEVSEELRMMQQRASTEASDLFKLIREECPHIDLEVLLQARGTPAYKEWLRRPEFEQEESP